MEADPHWGWTRNAIIDLLTEGFEDRPGALQCDRRHGVWDILKALTDDPHPSPEREKEDSGHSDSATLSINSARGRAFHALVEYALWRWRCIDVATPQEPPPPCTFEVMPEVREVLDEHLDPSRDPSLSIRSVHGMSLPRLAGLDWDWVRANLARMFPAGDGRTPFFRATSSCPERHRT